MPPSSYNRRRFFCVYLYIIRHCVMPRFLNFLLAMFTIFFPVAGVRADSPASYWKRHVIDQSSRGADGVRWDDTNGDHLPDIVTGWEEGGITCIYQHPGHLQVKKPWPRVVVGKTPSVEDATFVNLDGNASLDVVTCCEGDTRCIHLHWAPKAQDDYLTSSAWKTDVLPCSRNIAWMYCIPMQIDGKRGIDLVAGSKSTGAKVGWFESPENPRKAEDWKWHPLDDCGWIMSLYACDMDLDGDEDLLMSDRKGKQRGIRWLENPGRLEAMSKPWQSHLLADGNREVMFLAMGDLNRDGQLDLGWSVRPGPHRFLLSARRSNSSSVPYSIRLPENAGTGKAVAIGDMNGDGQPDIVATCEHADGERHGVWFHAVQADFLKSLDAQKTPAAEPTLSQEAHSVSGPRGVKYDRIELLDLDGDGDLDVLTCEERANLGVIWYENPCVR